MGLIAVPREKTWPAPRLPNGVPQDMEGWIGHRAGAGTGCPILVREGNDPSAEIPFYPGPPTKGSMMVLDGVWGLGEAGWRGHPRGCGEASSGGSLAQSWPWRAA